MSEFRELLRRLATRLVLAGIGALFFLAAIYFLLPRIALAATVFVASPGGLVLIILAWRLLGRRKSH